VRRLMEGEQPPVRPGTNGPRMASPWLDCHVCSDVSAELSHEVAPQGRGGEEGGHGCRPLHQWGPRHKLRQGLFECLLAGSVPGRRLETFYMLLEGMVRVKTAGEAGVEYGSGAAFDVVAMAERSPSRAAITAEGPVRMLVMSHAQFRAIASLPRLQDALWRVTSPVGVAPPLQPRHPDLAPVQRPARKWRPLCIDSAGADQVPTPAFAGRQATPLRSFEDSVGASFPAPEEDS